MFTHHIFHPTYFSPTRFFTHHIFHPPYFSPTTSFTHHIFHPPYFSPTTSFTQHIFHHILGRGGGVGSFLLVSIYQLISTITQYYMRGGGVNVSIQKSVVSSTGEGVPFSIQYLNLNYSYSSSLPLHCGEGGGEYHFSLSRQVPNFWRSISNLSAFSHYSFYINKPSLARVFYQKSHFKLTSYQLYQKH